MIRGTTPTIKLSVKNLDVSSLTSIFITLKQKEIHVDKEKKDILVMEDENMLQFTLSQDETLLFSDKGNVEIQLRGKINDSAIATNIVEISARRILKDGVI